VVTLVTELAAGFAAEFGFAWGFTFAGAVTTGLGAGAVGEEMGKGVASLFAARALVGEIASAFAGLVTALALLALLALLGVLTLLLEFVLTMTKAHQKGFNPSRLGQ
jgi:ABC-type uncharacterized transport system permease subunit